MRLDQFYWSKGYLTLYATKTESERDIPLWGRITPIVQTRISERLTNGGLLFPRSVRETYDGDISKACKKAATLAGLAYGRENGFTLHSLRHTFITHLMEVTNNDVGTVMKYSGHKSLESFSIYLRPTEEGRILATQAMEKVDPFLIPSAGIDGLNGLDGQENETAKVLEIKQAEAV